MLCMLNIFYDNNIIIIFMNYWEDKEMNYIIEIFSRLWAW